MYNARSLVKLYSSSVKSVIMLLPFLRELGTRINLLGPWLNNTEDYLTPRY